MSSLPTSKILCGFGKVEGGGDGFFVGMSIEYSSFSHLKGLTPFSSTAETRQPVNCKQSSFLIDIFLEKQ